MMDVDESSQMSGMTDPLENGSTGAGGESRAETATPNSSSATRKRGPQGKVKSALHAFSQPMIFTHS